MMRDSTPQKSQLILRLEDAIRNPGPASVPVDDLRLLLRVVERIGAEQWATACREASIEQRLLKGTAEGLARGEI